MEKIIIFGAGVQCQKLLDILSQNSKKLEIVAVVDNNSTKWGGFLDGVEIKAIEYIMDHDYEFVLITASCFRPLLEELTDRYQVNSDKIIVFDGNTLYLPRNIGEGELVTCLTSVIYDCKYISYRKTLENMNNGFADYLKNNNHREVTKWLNYFEIYDLYFQKYKGKPVKMLEIGVNRGGSLQMWKHYFGKQAQIIGVDINPDCKRCEEKQIEVRIGSQEDKDFLREFIREFGEFDIILDDGGHRMTQQITTFEETFPALKVGGLYLRRPSYVLLGKLWRGV